MPWSLGRKPGRKPGRPLGRPLGLLVASAIGVTVLVTALAQGRWAGTTAGSVSDTVWFLSFLVFPVVGLLIVWERPELAVGWVYLGVGVAQVAAGSLDMVAEHAAAIGSTTAAAWSILLSTLAFGTAWTLAANVALLVFPVENVPVRGRRALLIASVACYAVVVLGYTFGAGAVEEDLGLESPWAVSGWGEAPRRLADLALVGQVLIALVALVSLVLAWRRSTGRDRTQLMWLGFGAIVAILTAAVGSAAAPWGPAWVGPVTEAVVIASLPVATGIAVLRAGLFDVAAALDHTIVYAVLTGLVVATYFAVLAVVTGMLGDDAGRGASLLASAVVAVSLGPVKERLSRRVERSLYGDRAEPYRVLASLAERLERTTAVDDLIATVTETVQRTLRLPYVEVALDTGTPVPVGAVSLPLVAHGHQEGALVVGRHPGQSTFTPRELQLLEDLARQVAREVRASRLASDLQESQAGLVRAREEERLRVRRDLHDGVGPTLAAAALLVDALRERWHPDDPRVGELLEKVQVQIRQAILDVRGVVDGLRPPALDDLGLSGVVREHAEALGAAGLRVSVNCEEPLEIESAAVEVAAYRIVHESLTNVVRHARATSCEVTLVVRDGWLLIDVSDDGVGLGDAPGGVGLSSMRERAAELGGTLTLASGTSGTTVSAGIPLGGRA